MRIIFLDRDGVINEYPGDYQYVKSWEEFRFLPGVKEGLKKLSQSGFGIFIASNQAGVAKGVYSQQALEQITDRMLKELSAAGAKISGVYYCTHRQEDNCACRKPRTGLVDKAVSLLKKQGITPDLKKSYFIGDTMRDMHTARVAGLKTILVFSGKEKPENKDSWTMAPDYTCPDIACAAELILKDKQ